MGSNVTGTETSSASSSVTANASGGANRNDQVVHRFYIKTVEILSDGRLTHYGNNLGPKGEKKKDKWVRLYSLVVEPMTDPSSMSR